MFDINDSLALAILLVGFALLVALLFFDTFRMVAVAGRLRRGFRIWSTPLSRGQVDYLRNLDAEESLIEQRYRRFSRVVWARNSDFILKDDGQVMIRVRRRGWGTGWPLLGYVDLTATTPRLEYRGSLVAHLWLLVPAMGVLLLTAFPFNVVFAAVPVPVLLVSFWMESTAIHGFLAQQVASEPGAAQP